METKGAMDEKVGMLDLQEGEKEANGPNRVLPTQNQNNTNRIRRSVRLLGSITRFSSISGGGSSKRNIRNIREKVNSSKIVPEIFSYSQKISETFLEEWLDFPLQSHFILLNNIILPMRWLLWTSKNLLGLDPADKTLRDRLASSINVLGTAAGLFLVIAVAALLQPPGSQLSDPPPQWAVDLYGIFMLISGASYIGYIAFSLTVLHPILQSLRDDVLFDAYERYMRRWGGYDLYLFNLGLHAMICGLILACYILYSLWALIVILVLAASLYGMTIFFSRECFLSLDPISAMHLGLTNNTSDQLQAEKLSTYLLHHIPNTILRQDDDNETKKEQLQTTVKAFSDVTDVKKSTKSQERFEELNKSPLIAASHKKFNNKKKINVSEAKTEVSDPIQVLVPEAGLPRDLYDIFSKQEYLPGLLSSKECEFIYDKLCDEGITTTEQLISYLNDMKQCLPTCQCVLFNQYLSTYTPAIRQQQKKKAMKKRPFQDRGSNEVKDRGGEDDDTDNIATSLVSNNEVGSGGEWIGVDYSGLHNDFCCNRLSSCWLKALEGILLSHEGGSKVSIHSINIILNFFKPFLR